MRIAVMQPYTFPYIGYFQLVAAADCFVFFNDVNFIKKGWINRNSILNQQQPYLFSIPLVKASQNKKINEIDIFEYSTWREKFIKMIEFNYHHAVHFKDAFGLICKILFKKDFLKIDDLAAQSVIDVSKYIGLKTQFMFSSDLPYQGDDGQDKILDICRELKANEYINPQNGAFQYQASAFNSCGVDLFFLEPVIAKYAQYINGTFIPSLSIIDLLMFNSREQLLIMAEDGQILKENTDE